MTQENKKNSLDKAEKKSGGGQGTLKIIGSLIVAFALAALLFSSLAGGTGAANNSQLSFGRYGDKKIIYNYDNSFGRAVDNELRKYQSSFGQDDQILSYIRNLAWRQAYNTTVVSTAIAYHLEQSGYLPSSKSIDRRVVERGPYRTEGEFDEAKYASSSESQRKVVRTQLREQAFLEIWSEDIITAPYRPQAQRDFLKAMRLPLNVYDYIILPFSEFPDDSVLHYAQENSTLFRQASLSRIAVDDKETADTVSSEYSARKLELGAFAALAQEYSTDSYKEEGGSMGNTFYYQLTEIISPEDAQAVFALKEGEIIGPLETEYGWILFRLDELTQDIALEDHTEDIRTYMLNNALGLIEDTILADAQSLRLKAIGANSFAQTMEAEGITVNTTEPFPINYAGDSLLGSSPETGQDTQLSGAMQSDDFWKKIISLKEIGAISDPIILNSSALIFSLVSQSNNEEESDSFWDIRFDNEASRTREQDFQSVILDSESKIFDDDFTATYQQIFPLQN